MASPETQTPEPERAKASDTEPLRKVAHELRLLVADLTTAHGDPNMVTQLADKLRMLTSGAPGSSSGEIAAQLGQYADALRADPNDVGRATTIADRLRAFADEIRANVPKTPEEPPAAPSAASPPAPAGTPPPTPAPAARKNPPAPGDRT